MTEIYAGGSEKTKQAKCLTKQQRDSQVCPIQTTESQRQREDLERNQRGGNTMPVEEQRRIKLDIARGYK